jgi:hypothetical protein
MGTIYIVTDCEFDGPTPGQNSLLSFASVALTAAGAVAGEFEATLARLPGAARDRANMAFWDKHPGAWAAATADPQPPAIVMNAFADWVRKRTGDTVFAAHPLAIDGPWIDHYLQRFAGARICEGPWVADRLFKDLPVCIRSYAAGKLGWPFDQCDVPTYPAEWLGDHEHTHRAIDDARGYAALLQRLLGRNSTGDGRASEPRTIR